MRGTGTTVGSLAAMLLACVSCGTAANSRARNHAGTPEGGGSSSGAAFVSQELATGSFADPIAIDSTSVYAVCTYCAAPNLFRAGLAKVPIGGGPVTVLAYWAAPAQNYGSAPAQNVDTIAGIAVDSANVYWTSQDGLTNPVMRTPVGGGTSTALATNPQGHPSEIVVDATSVYWINSGSCAGCAGALLKVPIAGGTPSTLATGDLRALVLDATNLYFFTPALVKMPKGGGPTVTLVPNTDYPNGVALDGSKLYWTDASTHAVMTVPKDGGTAMALVPASDAPERQFAGFRTGPLAVDSTSIYWLAFVPQEVGSVMKAPIGGGTPSRLALGGGESGWNGIAVDATSVYWTTSTLISKVAKQ